MYETNGEMDDASSALMRKLDDAYTAFICEHFGVRETDVIETDDGSGIHQYDSEEYFALALFERVKPEFVIETNGLNTMTTVLAKMHESWCLLGRGILVDRRETFNTTKRKGTWLVMKRI